MHTYFIIGLALATLLGACQKSDPYAPDQFLGDAQRDSLKIDLVNYMDVRPDGVTTQNRFAAQHRDHYRERAALWSFQRYHVAEDSTHYFYMIRPTRSANPAHRRGVGGTYRLGADGAVTQFREVFVTAQMPEDELKEKGEVLFAEFVKTGDVASYIGQRAYVEWPDSRTYYDTTIYEWAYRKDY